jgi:hypothetical protein
MSDNLITTILTHNSSFLISGQGTAYLKIEVFFSKETKKYQMKFDFRACHFKHYDPSQITYINDIPYMPKTILELIKLIRLADEQTNLPSQLEPILKGTLEQDLKKEVKEHNDFLRNLRNDETFQKLGLAEDKIRQLETSLKEKNTQLEKKVVETKDLALEVNSLREKAGSAELRRASNELQHKKEFEKTRKEKAEVVEKHQQLLDMNKRLLETINNEKLKIKSLENKLSDMTALYESLLETTY